MPSFEWKNLTPMQLGKYAEYYVKMEFASYGFQVFSSEINDSSVDFIVKGKSKKYYEVQVRSIRETSGYVFTPKDRFDVEQENLFMALVIFKEDYHPKLFLIPAKAWKEPNDLLRDRDYEGLKSKPEWGINTSKKNMPLLDEYGFASSVGLLK